jgi:hypothetical protein
MARRRGETRAERRERWKRVRSILDDLAGRLGLKTRGGSPHIRGQVSGGRLDIVYFAGTSEGELPAHKHRFIVTFRRRWTDRRVVVRRGRPLATDRRMRRFARRLEALPPGARMVAIEVFDRFEGPILLTHNTVRSHLPPTATVNEIVERARSTIAYVDRLAAAG